MPIGSSDLATYSPGDGEGIWEGPGLRVFICHIAEQKAFANDVKTYLEEWGITSFVAHTDIEPDAEWRDVIQRALRSCEALVALLHDGF